MSKLDDFIFGFVYEMLDTDSYDDGRDICVPYSECGYDFDSFDDVSKRIIRGECNLCYRYIAQRNNYNDLDFVELGQLFYRVRNRLLRANEANFGKLFEAFLPMAVIFDEKLQVISFANISYIQKKTKHLRLLEILEMRMKALSDPLPSMAEQYLDDLQQFHSKLMYMITAQNSKKDVRFHNISVRDMLNFLCGYSGVVAGYKLLNAENDFYFRTINQLIDYIKCLKPEIIDLPLKTNADLKNYISYIISNGETYVRSI